MITIRQLERLWLANDYRTILQLCLQMRPEASPRLGIELSKASAAAAMAVIRLDELSQSHVPFCARMIRAILAAQETDGGWGDALTTALCLKALLGDAGSGPAIERGLAYLAGLQKSDGLWPKIPLRRLPSDPYVSAFVLFQLADHPHFRDTVRADDAAHWFESHQTELDSDTARLWRTVTLRHRTPTPTAYATATQWS